MDFKYIKPIRIIAYILTAAFLIGAIWYGWNNRQVKISHLQSEINILYNYKLNEPGLKERIANLEADNKQLQADLENLNIKYAADEKCIDVLESRYLKVVTYANVAEIILKNNGINFTRIDE